MRFFLALARLIDGLNERVGRFTHWLILACVLISAGNAIARYGFSLSSNAFLEIQWYLYSIVFLGAAGYTLKHNAHVRIDLVSGRLSQRTQAWIDVFGALFMLLPVCAIIVWYGGSAFIESYRIGELSADAGGLARWPIKLVLPLAFLLLMLQGVAETIKRLAFLAGDAAQPEAPGREHAE
ncbi:MAG: TRAP transporter small permease subunit [Burkholderiales bacterium]|nr:TRAP transporter small permease subunit [Burkholderiales bacterium]